jgi:hypothetical protein
MARRRRRRQECLRPLGALHNKCCSEPVPPGPATTVAAQSAAPTARPSLAQPSACGAPDPARSSAAAASTAAAIEAPSTTSRSSTAAPAQAHASASSVFWVVRVAAATRRIRLGWPGHAGVGARGEAWAGATAHVSMQQKLREQGGRRRAVRQAFFAHSLGPWAAAVGAAAHNVKASHPRTPRRAAPSARRSPPARPPRRSAAAACRGPSCAGNPERSGLG